MSTEECQNISYEYVDGFSPTPRDVQATQRESKVPAAGSPRTSLKDGEHYYRVADSKNIHLSKKNIHLSKKNIHLSKKNIHLSKKNTSCNKPPSPKTSVDLEMDDESYLEPNPRCKPAKSRKASVEKKGGFPLRNTSTEPDVPMEEAPALPTNGRRKKQEDYDMLDVKRGEEENVYSHLKEYLPKLPKRWLRRDTANSAMVFASFVLCITLSTLLYFYINSVQKMHAMEISVLRQETKACRQETSELWNIMAKLGKYIINE